MKKRGGGVVGGECCYYIDIGSVEGCSTEGREKQAIACRFEGALMRDSSTFPYFFLVALEAGSLARALVLLLTYPLAWLLGSCLDGGELLAIRLMAFVSTCGLPVADVEAVSKAVLPRFYADDVHPGTFRAFSSPFSDRHVIASSPRLLVEPFCRAYLGATCVVGAELETTPGGTATGFLKPPNSSGGFGKQFLPTVGIDSADSQLPFIGMCKERYLVRDAAAAEPLPREKLMQPLVFHDGRLVQRPTPFNALVTLLWLPIGFPLAVFRVASGILAPARYLALVFRLTGTRVIVKGKPPSGGSGIDEEGFLFVCSHRTLLDPVFVSAALERKVAALTYSISRLSELISPIKTIRLTRDRASDAASIRTQLQRGDLVICPEGTTCREPFLLRFSSLFAELTDRIVPVALRARATMFHGSAVRGYKALDCFFFFMNPFPVYEVTFHDRLPPAGTVTSAGGAGVGGGSNNAHDVANHIQKLLAKSLGFTCTSFTRKDKYGMLVGSDGSVPSSIPPR